MCIFVWNSWLRRFTWSLPTVRPRFCLARGSMFAPWRADTFEPWTPDGISFHSADWQIGPKAECNSTASVETVAGEIQLGSTRVAGDRRR